MFKELQHAAVSAAVIALSASACGGEPKVLTLASSISQAGSNSEPSIRMKHGMETALRWLNGPRGGIEVGGERYELQFVYFDDNSNRDRAKEIAEEVCANTAVQHFWAPYSSGLTAVISPVLDACGKLVMNAGAASDSLYSQGYKQNVQMFSPGSHYHKGTLDLLASKLQDPASKKVALLYKDDAFAQTTAVAAKAYAEALGFQVVYYEKYGRDADINDDAFRAQVQALAALKPHAFLGGGHTEDGRALATFLHWEVTAAAQAGSAWDLEAVSLLVAPASSDFYEKVQFCPEPCAYTEHPAEGISTPAQWAPQVRFSAESAASAGKAWFGPSLEEFDSIYREVAAGGDLEASYHGAAGTASVLIFAMAAEKAGSLEPAALFSAMRSLDVVTMFGGFAIDDTGLQVGHTMVEVQWQRGGMNIVWPNEAKSEEMQLRGR